ncbi:MAG: NUMOD4 domain-containing protein [bacterium]|nr:NUMOD4 domain-containing protein [bacterium]
MNEEKNKISRNITEQWKAVQGYEGYEISNYGRIRSYRREQYGSNPYIMKPSGSEYLSTMLSKNGKAKTHRIHRLVAEYFLEKPLKQATLVNHKDGNKMNNHVDNLEWITLAENTAHMFKLRPRQGGVMVKDFKEKLNPFFVEKVISNEVGVTEESFGIYLTLLWIVFESWLNTLGNFKNSIERLDYIRMSKTEAPGRDASINFLNLFMNLSNDNLKQLVDLAKINGLVIYPTGVHKTITNAGYFPQNNPADILALIYETVQKIIHDSWKLNSDNLNQEKIIKTGYYIFNAWIKMAHNNGYLKSVNDKQIQLDL